MLDQTSKDLLAQVIAQQKTMVAPQFSADDAHAIGLTLRDRSITEGRPITIDIRRGQHLLFHCAMEGTSPDNAGWVARKVAVVERFHMSSLRMGLECRAVGRSIEERFHLPPNQFADHGGAVPIMVKNSGMVGIVTVSGLPQVEDHAWAVAAIKAHYKL